MHEHSTWRGSGCIYAYQLEHHKKASYNVINTCSTLTHIFYQDSKDIVHLTPGQRPESMSKLMLKNKHFLQLLFTTEPPQQKALLRSITLDQTLVLSEIFFNLLHHVKVSTNVKSLIKSRRRVLAKIADRDIPIEERANAIEDHVRIVLQTLLLVKGELKQLLK